MAKYYDDHRHQAVGVDGIEMPKSTAPFPRRKSSSSCPFSALPRSKPGSRKSSLAEKESAVDRLHDTGLTPSLAPPGVAQDVLSLLRHIRQQPWDPIPEVAGMNSSRIAEILRLRGSLPPVVSLAQLHALSVSPTATERELAGLIAQGVVRRVVTPHRGAKGSGTVAEEGVVLVESWQSLLSEHEAIDSTVRSRYTALMDAHPRSATTLTASLDREEVQQLVRAGYLTNPSALADAGGLPTVPGLSSLLELSKAGYSAPTGSLAAIGGTGAVHESGGGGSALATQYYRRPTAGTAGSEMTFALPNTGAYLKLLTSARLHLLALLKQLSPRYKEAIRELLRERWEGNVLGDATSVAKRARGEWSGVLPGKTKKWRDFYGLRFEWVLAQCVGAGLVEVFDTGSVGMGVRAR
ncbi:hypothetical protein LTR53_005025 [Teratosphaeriaceae sp. CCFEE 6253]|nr:hypothetical protein LTR53_005025 [Teratosphaeriaceae sp. CCFEE 6253]